MFSSPARAAELLRGVLPPALVRQIDRSSLVLQPGSFVAKRLRAQHVDLLFTARYRGGGALRIYILCEHKSSPDERVGLALHRYMGEVWDQHVKLLRHKFESVPRSAVKRVNAAEARSVHRWLGRVLTAASLDEVFADEAG